MIKKLLILLLSSFFFFINTAKAQNIIKINSINFDNSDSVVFLGTSGIDGSSPILIEKGKLQNPDRLFFDIKNAVYTPKSGNFILKNSKLKQIKIAQFSSAPGIVRIVVYYDQDFNPDQLQVLKQNNNLMLKISNTVPNQDYLTQIYREIKNSSSDFYDKTMAIPESALTSTSKPQVQKQVIKAPVPNSSTDMFNQIQKAFNETTDQMYYQVNPNNTPKSISPQYKPNPTSQPVRENPPLKESKLKSSYYLDRIDVKNGNILVSGVGTVSLEKFIYLSNPTRIVIDLPNTIIADDLKGKELQITQNETVKIGQFETSKARIVITTNEPQKYRPIYSFDLQGLLIAHDERMGNVKLFNNSAEITQFKITPVDDITNNLVIDFSNQVVHSIKRDDAKLEIELYNASLFNPEEFRQIIRSSRMPDIRIEKMAYQGAKIVIPIEKTTTIDCYENLSATQLKITIKTPKEEPKYDTITTAPIPKCPTGRIVVLDPGHGGSDTGALRAGQCEKDINLDIAKKTAAILISKGIHVEMTRWNDSTVSLENRVTLSNCRKPDVYVSIHINSCVKPEIYGIETHYYKEPGFEVARIVHKSLMANIPSIDRGLFKSRFYVINHTEAPSVLLELGFISNDRERNSLLTEERKNKSAEAIAEGIINYLNTQPKR